MRFGQAIALLKNIYDSGDTGAINAVESNLHTADRYVERGKTIQDQNKKIQSLESTIESQGLTIETQCRDIAELKAAVFFLNPTRKKPHNKNKGR